MEGDDSKLEQEIRDQLNNIEKDLKKTGNELGCAVTVIFFLVLLVNWNQSQNISKIEGEIKNLRQELQSRP